MDIKEKAVEFFGGFCAQKVEMEGVEPSSKQGTPMVSTCLFRFGFRAAQGSERPKRDLIS